MINFYNFLLYLIITFLISLENWLFSHITLLIFLTFPFSVLFCSVSFYFFLSNLHLISWAFLKIKVILQRFYIVFIFFSLFFSLVLLFFSINYFSSIDFTSLVLPQNSTCRRSLSMFSIREETQLAGFKTFSEIFCMKII